MARSSGVELNDVARHAEVTGWRSPLAAQLQEHLGIAGDAMSSTSVSLPLIERVNVQLALNAYESQTGRWELIGLISYLSNYGRVSLPGMVSGSWRGPWESARQYVAVRTRTTSDGPANTSSAACSSIDRRGRARRTRSRT